MPEACFTPTCLTANIMSLRTMTLHPLIFSVYELHIQAKEIAKTRSDDLNRIWTIKSLNVFRQATKVQLRLQKLQMKGQKEKERRGH